MSFDYKKYDRVDVHGKRFYALPADVYYPSITTILGGTMPPEKSKILDAWIKGFGKEKAKAYTERAADRGTKVHELIEKHLKGESLDGEDKMSISFQIFNSLKLALSKINKVYGQEVVLFCNDLQVAGSCDLICEFQGELAIVDYKTSMKPKSEDMISDYWLQTCFYALAHNEMFGTNIKKLVILMGSEKGLPLIFKKEITEELVEKLVTRIDKFYKEL